jgi:hypothetical protein
VMRLINPAKTSVGVLVFGAPGIRV